MEYFLTKLTNLQVKKIADFLGKNYSDDIIDKIADHCSYENMKRNPCLNMEDVPAYDSKISPFLRKGKIGDWRNFFSEDEAAKFDRHYKQKMMSGTDLDFDFE